MPRTDLIVALTGTLASICSFNFEGDGLSGERDLAGVPRAGLLDPACRGLHLLVWGEAAAELYRISVAPSSCMAGGSSSAFLFALCVARRLLVASCSSVLSSSSTWCSWLARPYFSTSCFTISCNIRTSILRDKGWSCNHSILRIAMVAILVKF